MSNLKFTTTDAETFYTELYKGLYKEENYIEKNFNKKSEIELIVNSNNPLALKQVEYYPLAMDFFEIAKEKKLNAEVLLGYLGMTAETWSIWVDSYKSGAIQTPITLNKDSINKMAVFSLKHHFNNYVLDKGIEATELNKSDIIKDLIVVERHNKIGLSHETKPKIKKIKP